MTNAQRGEVILTMGDRQIAGRMTLDTLMRIESSLGMSIVKAMRLVADGDLTTAQIIGILLPIVKAGDEHLDESELKKIIWENGVTEALREVARVLMQALSAGDSGGNDLADEVPQ